MVYLSLSVRRLAFIPWHSVRCSLTLHEIIFIFTHQVQTLHSHGGLPRFAFTLYRSTSLLLGLQRRPLLSSRSRLSLDERGKALVESVRIDELLCVLDLHIPAWVFVDVVIDERLIWNDGPGFQRHNAGNL